MPFLKVENSKISLPSSTGIPSSGDVPSKSGIRSNSGNSSTSGIASNSGIPSNSGFPSTGGLSPLQAIKERTREGSQPRLNSATLTIPESNSTLRSDSASPASNGSDTAAEREDPPEPIEGKSLVTFNVGGTVFQTFFSSFIHLKETSCKLMNPEFMSNHWDNDRREYFFDRNPEMFSVIFNYMRTGKLHLPNDMCSPQITDELIYWGMSRTQIEICCWKDFSIGVQSIQNLHKLENDRQPIYMTDDIDAGSNEDIRRPWSWKSFLKAIYKTVTDEAYSRLAKIYAMVSLIGVSASLLSFVAQTTYEDGCNNATHPFVDFHKFTQDTCIVFTTIDMICFLFFLLDIVLHLIWWPEVCNYLKSLGFFIDFLALVPDSVDLIMAQSHNTDDYAILNVMKLLRVVRLFRFMHRLTGVMVVIYALWKSVQELTATLTILCVTIAVFASMVIFAEKGKNSQFHNYFDGVWYSAITLTTVGYGDIVPKTVFGKIIGALCAVWGVLILGITIPTMVNNFLQYHFMMNYIKEREMIYLYQRDSTLERPPDIRFPDFL